MAVDLRGTQTYPHPKKISNVSIATMEIKLPPSARKISFYSPAKKVYVSKDATDGGSLPADYWEIPSGQGYEMQIGTGLQQPQSLFISVDSGTGTVFLLLEEDK